MIAKLKSNRSVHDTIQYNLKQNSELIDSHNLVGDSIQDYEQQMRLTQQLFDGRAKNLTAHIILSPGIEDGRKLQKNDWRAIARSYLNKTMFDTYESIVFLHQDKEHWHLHIVANRIDDRGKIYRNGHELYLSQRVGNEIARERGMLQAREVRMERKQLKENGTSVQIMGSVNVIREELKKAAITVVDLNKKFDDELFLEELKKLGYKVKRFLNKDTGVLRGYGVGKEDCFYNSSDLGKEFTLRSLRDTLEESISKKESIIKQIYKIKQSHL